MAKFSNRDFSGEREIVLTGLDEAGIAGKEYLREALTNCADPMKAIEDFQTENGILLPSLRPIRERERKLKELLQKSFALINVPKIKPVVLCILKNMDRVEDRYLRLLVSNKNLYDECDVQRRQGEVVQKLLTMIGHNVKLYDMVLQFLRTLFLKTKNVHYCTLRSELLMALHDLEIQEITHVDPCFLDSIKRGNEQVLGDLSMTLCDPYAVNFLATSALKIIMYLINQEGYARENTVLVLLLRMLALGLQAWEMISTQVYKEPKLDAQLVTKFLPSLMSLMVDDQVRAINAKLPQDDRESAITTIEHFVHHQMLTRHTFKKME
ncbi:negative elongation factor B [Caerostris extrusa]|uniref:Negative elongation factor B n=1 Tax=Caerostris extrusa TaxID=172846 RepID=A0AAV4PIR6_CAEEX|nr:negative elongation factor B [Caerostris extrusa]